jgi:aryl-alcohol dehydrogenase-like predicted oxidoreductase
LARLELEYVDIVYAHRPDRLTPMEETVRAFNHVIDKGWAFYWGTSEWSADEISEACGIAKSLGLIGPIVEQPLYNIIDRQKVEGEYQRLYTRCGIGLTTFSPLKMGLLTGKYNDADKGPPEGSRFAESKDKFAEFMRGQYGGEEWMGNVNKVKSLKVCFFLFYFCYFPVFSSIRIYKYSCIFHFQNLFHVFYRLLHSCRIIRPFSTQWDP